MERIQLDRYDDEILNTIILYELQEQHPTKTEIQKGSYLSRDIVNKHLKYLMDTGLIDKYTGKYNTTEKLGYVDINKI